MGTVGGRMARERLQALRYPQADELSLVRVDREHIAEPKAFAPIDLSFEPQPVELLEQGEADEHSATRVGLAIDNHRLLGHEKVVVDAGDNPVKNARVGGGLSLTTADDNGRFTRRREAGAGAS